jgi:hypothetical protein
MNAPLKPRALVNPFFSTATPTLEDVALRIAASDLKSDTSRNSSVRGTTVAWACSGCGFAGEEVR